jgi:hypothetical protein
MKIILQCLYTDTWIDIARIVLPNIASYAQRRGYSLNVKCYSEPCPSDFGYNKLKEIKYIFDTDTADVVVSLDLDLLITNYNYKIEDFLNDKNDFYITDGYNAGVFILKKSEWSYKFIDYILSQQGVEGMYCEQDAILKYISENGTSEICVLPHPSINSFNYDLYPEYGKVKHNKGQWEEGDFILHLPGIGMDKRKEILSTTKVIL